MKHNNDEDIVHILSDRNRQLLIDKGMLTDRLDITVNALKSLKEQVDATIRAMERDEDYPYTYVDLDEYLTAVLRKLNK